MEKEIPLSEPTWAGNSKKCVTFQAGLWAAGPIEMLSDQEYNSRTCVQHTVGSLYL